MWWETISFIPGALNGIISIGDGIDGIIGVGVGDGIDNLSCDGDNIDGVEAWSGVINR